MNNNVKFTVKAISTQKNVDDYEYAYDENLYVFCDLNGKFIDDAQGYGYKSIEAATKAFNFKDNNGVEKAKKLKIDAL